MPVELRVPREVSIMREAFVIVTLCTLLFCELIYIYQEFFQSNCIKPFVQVGDYCYFFSTNKPNSYEYYKVPYKGRTLSVPAMLDWLHAGFGCETLDTNAHLVSIESAQEMRALADYMRHSVHSDTKSAFWSSGHRGQAMLKTADQIKKSLAHFYWLDYLLPMNFTNWAANAPKSNDWCIYLEFTGDELLMSSTNCEERMAYVCELTMT